MFPNQFQVIKIVVDESAKVFVDLTYLLVLQLISSHKALGMRKEWTFLS